MAKKTNNGKNFGTEADLVKIERRDFPLTRINFYIMGAAAAMILIGFLLMLGGSTSTEEFNPDIFSTRRIVIAPAIVFIGFIVMAVAIVYRPKRKLQEEPVEKVGESEETERTTIDAK